MLDERHHRCYCNTNKTKQKNEKKQAILRTITFIAVRGIIVVVADLIGVSFEWCRRFLRPPSNFIDF